MTDGGNRGGVIKYLLVRIFSLLGLTLCWLPTWSTACQDEVSTGHLRSGLLLHSGSKLQVPCDTKASGQAREFYKLVDQASCSDFCCDTGCSDSVLEAPEGFEFMFSYGANMGSHVFEDAGLERPLISEPARLASHCLSFGHAFAAKPDVGYASIVPCPQGCSLGVVHMLPAGQVESVFDPREPCYTRTKVEVRTCKGRMQAWTYVSTSINRNAKPTSRYMNLLYCGALEAGIPRPYPEFLKKLAKRVGLGSSGQINLNCKKKSRRVIHHGKLQNFGKVQSKASRTEQLCLPSNK